MCISLVIQERAAAAVSVAANLPFAPMLSPPQFFADTVIKFSSRLMHVLKDQCSLKELCGNLVNVGSPARTEKIFVRLVLPTCIRLGSGRSGEFTTRASTFWQSRLKEIVFTTEVQFILRVSWNKTNTALFKHLTKLRRPQKKNFRRFKLVISCQKIWGNCYRTSLKTIDFGFLDSFAFPFSLTEEMASVYFKLLL